MNSINNNADSNKRVNKEFKIINNEINPFVSNKISAAENQKVISYCSICERRSNINVISQEQNFEIRKAFALQSKLDSNEIDKE